jgi:hypothetical protein
VAGAQLALTVTRMDRYGNRVPRREVGWCRLTL